MSGDGIDNEDPGFHAVDRRCSKTPGDSRRKLPNSDRTGTRWRGGTYKSAVSLNNDYWPLVLGFTICDRNCVVSETCPRATAYYNLNTAQPTSIYVATPPFHAQAETLLQRELLAIPARQYIDRV